MPVNLLELQETPLEELLGKASELNIGEPEGLRRNDLVFAVASALGAREKVLFGRGVLEVHGEGFGFLRSPDDNYLPGNADIYVSQSQIRRFKLKTGDTVIGHVREPKDTERYLALLRVEQVNGEKPGIEPPTFESLTAIYPDERISLESNALLQPIDLVAPMGLGQRGLLVAPSRTSRVELLRRFAEVLTADDELEVTTLLIDERPEEINEWRKELSCEVIATPFDEQPARHLQVADIVFERARRMVERGDDIVLIVDSFTRLLRACLAEVNPAGRTIGGIDAASLHRLRRYMSAARALEEGGSLTVIAVVSGDPDNRMDQAVLEDLRDVVNWELTLSRDLADRGIRPPIDVHRSGTRRVERLLSADELADHNTWRGGLTGDPIEDGAALVARFSERSALDRASESGQ